MVDTAVETTLAFKLVKTAGQCRIVHGKFPIVLDFLVTTTSSDTSASKGNAEHVATLQRKLGKLVTTVPPLSSLPPKQMWMRYLPCDK